MSSPRIAFFDIENFPSKGYFWGHMWQTDIIEVTEPWYMLSFAYQWQGEKTIHFRSLPDYPLFKKDKKNDRMLIEDLRNLFDEADVLIAHNGNRFDIKKSTTRFLIHGFKPPSPFKSIDTYLEAKNIGLFESNKLDNLARDLGLGEKLPTTGFKLWKQCAEGDPAAWAHLEKYNKRDVLLAKGVYEILKPYMKSHPDLTIYDEEEGCPICRSKDVHRRGIYVSKRRRYQQFCCNGCGKWFSGAYIKHGDELLDTNHKKRSWNK